MATHFIVLAPTLFITTIYRIMFRRRRRKNEEHFSRFYSLFNNNNNTSPCDGDWERKPWSYFYFAKKKKIVENHFGKLVMPFSIFFLFGKNLRRVQNKAAIIDTMNKSNGERTRHQKKTTKKREKLAHKCGQNTFRWLTLKVNYI